MLFIYNEINRYILILFNILVYIPNIYIDRLGIERVFSCLLCMRMWNTRHDKQFLSVNCICQFVFDITLLIIQRLFISMHVLWLGMEVIASSCEQFHIYNIVFILSGIWKLHFEIYYKMKLIFMNRCSCYYLRILMSTWMFFYVIILLS